MNPILSRALLGALLLAVAACASDPDALPPDNPFKGGKSERELRLEAGALYRLARRSLDAADFATALQRYGQIQLKYPFTDYSTQAQLESIYAKYRSFDPDGALSTADRFLKEHPRHSAVEYVHYLKGLINFQRGEALFDWFESERQDVGHARRAFDDFALLLQRYPDSRYAGDARLRMIHLRNRIAAHELAIVRFYVRRGAHVAAAKRAEKILSDYSGAPATLEALVLLEQSYRAAGLTDQAEDARRLREANAGIAGAAPAPAPAPAASAPPPDFVLQPGAVVREIGADGGAVVAPDQTSP
jgi:outer membrane protein assembly factor BamD